jgi:hypothetical protein
MALAWAASESYNSLIGLYKRIFDQRSFGEYTLSSPRRGMDV